MIVRPKRSVTYFFVPLIDVLILLFCIFLLMPFVSTGETETDANAKVKEKPKDELPKDVKQLQAELEKARREVERLKLVPGNLAQSRSIKEVRFERVDPMDPKSKRKLFYFQDSERIPVTTDAEATNLIDIHRRASGTKVPFFLIIYPREGAEKTEDEKHLRWFEGVEFLIYTTP
ncbi:MAG: hypothetical protein EXS09_16760 [Gemmataceae bacterium]|nr:hypothetical protein [Gemmataceae bacterium]